MKVTKGLWVRFMSYQRHSLATVNELFCSCNYKELIAISDFLLYLILRRQFKFFIALQSEQPCKNTQFGQIIKKNIIQHVVIVYCYHYYYVSLVYFLPILMFFLPFFVEHNPTILYYYNDLVFGLMVVCSMLSVLLLLLLLCYKYYNFTV